MNGQRALSVFSAGTGTNHDTAQAVCTADAAPAPPQDVEISGLDDVTLTPEAGAATVEISDEFDVVPSGADCIAYATPGTAQTAPATGTARTVSLEVAARTSEYAVVFCEHGGDSASAAAEFTARPAGTGPGCPSKGGGTRSTRTSDSCPVPEVDPCSGPLSPGEPGQAADNGSITADPECTSSLRSPTSTSTYYARRYRFTLDDPAWVTVDLEPDPAESPRLDTCPVLSGDSLTRPITNDDARDPAGYYYDSRIGPVLLAAGDYTAEATTYGIGDTGDYTLTAEITATGLAENHTATVGAPKQISFSYWPADAEIAIRAAANEELQPHITTTPVLRLISPWRVG